MFDVELLAQAERELANAYDWYEEKQTKLGDRFFKEIDYYLAILKSNPYQYQVKYKAELRSAPLNTFPFLIIYWIDDERQIIFVASIFHTSRDPKYF